MENYKVTIITVCYNSEKTITKTIDSVFSQDYKNIQYIIKDGDSADSTNMIVNSYKTKFEARKIDFRHIISSDRGIYHAMNQAINYADGEWVLFLNSDDFLYSKNVLSDVFKDKSYNENILYGDSISIYGNGRQLMMSHDHTKLTERMSLCHQACFVQSEVMKKNFYNEKYLIGADYDFFLRAYLKGLKYRHLDLIICCYSKEGVSSKKLVQSYTEFLQIRKVNNLKNFNKFIIIGKYVSKFIRGILN